MKAELGEMAGAALLLVLLAPVVGCTERPLSTAEPQRRVVFIDHIVQAAVVDKIDLLFVPRPIHRCVSWRR